MATKFTSVEEYLDALAPEVRSAVEAVRRTIHAALPGATDAISYNMPTVNVEDRRIVHYAGWKAHVSLYPAPEDDPDLERDLAPYVAGRGTLKFPLDQPVPYELITRVVQRLNDVSR